MKLEEIDEKYGIFDENYLVIDVGAAPGGWSQYAARRVQPAGKIIAVDRLEVDGTVAAGENITFLQGDFCDEAIQARLAELLQNRAADVVISDMCPNITGIDDVDAANMETMFSALVAFACRHLAPRGWFVAKCFMGAAQPVCRRMLQQAFSRVNHYHSDTTWAGSREFYFVASGKI